jgi:type I restriction enzyme S subunit
MCYLASDLAMEMVRRYDNGTAQPNLSSASLGKFLVPLPPLDEQNRIVSKLDEVTGLCRALKADLAGAAATQRRLADAIVETSAA